MSQPNEFDSPIDCGTLYFMGLTHVGIFTGSLAFNSHLVWTYVHNRRKENAKSSIDLFVAVLAFLNFVGSLFELPFVMMSQFHCKWVFTPFGCKFSAFLMYFIGCSSIHMMTCISIERYYVIKNTLVNGVISDRTKIKIIAFCLSSGFFWASMPLIGWSSYTLEKSRTSCSILWNNKSTLVFSYNLSVFIFVYLIPLIIMIVTYLKLLNMVFRLRTVLAEPHKKFLIKKRMFIERRAAFTMITITAGFMCAWTPYAVVAMYIVFVDSKGFSPTVEAVPSMIAKSSMIWTSVLYFVLNKNEYRFDSPDDNDEDNENQQQNEIDEQIENLSP